MKKFTLLSALLFVLFSCGSDDAETVTTPASIVGTWKLQTIVNENENQELDSCELQNTFQFLANGTAAEQDYYTGTGNVCTAQTPQQATYALNGTALTLVYTVNTYAETVAELTAEKLVLVVNQRYNGPDGGTPFTVTYKRVD